MIDMFYIFEDLYECASEGSLDQLFTLMENVMNQTEVLQKLQEKELRSLLSFCSKICKMIMYKLSVTKDTGFRGRIQTLIASAFPLNHPSGLNRSGLFNEKNITEYQSFDVIKEELVKQRGINDISASNYRTYKNFWNLQKYLTNPFQIFSNEKLGFEDSQEIEEEGIENKTQEVQNIDTINDDQEMSLGEEEEGQADIAQTISSTKLEESNLHQVLVTIEEFLCRFQSQPLNVDKENAQILQRYPKYLSKYSLLSLQFQDYLFRDTFLVQVLIFLQTLQTPINERQKKSFILTDKEKRKIQDTWEKIQELLADNKISEVSKQKQMSDYVNISIKQEINWAKMKENKTFNFQRPVNLRIQFKEEQLRKRDKKLNQKLMNKQPMVKGQAANTNKDGIQLQSILKLNKESIEIDTYEMKECQTSTLNQFVNAICIDIDPEQGIEDEYKKKHNQVFCWRFLRTIASIDLVNFHGENSNKFVKFEGNIEQQAQLIQSKSQKKPIIKEVENGDSWQEEGQQEEKNNNGNGKKQEANGE